MIGKLTTENEVLRKSLTAGKLSTREKRTIITNDLSAFGNIRKRCQMLSLVPSTYYYKPKGQPLALRKHQADLQDHIETIACEFPRYGYRRMTAQLKARRLSCQPQECVAHYVSKLAIMPGKTKI